MTSGHCIAVFGIGSSHGADRFGWSVIEALRAAFVERARTDVLLECLRAPVDLLGHLEAVDELILCDASVGQQATACLCAWTWPEVQAINSNLSTGTHAFGLMETIVLADKLMCLPSPTHIVTADFGDAGEASRMKIGSCSQFAALVQRAAEVIDLHIQSGGGARLDLARGGTAHA